MASTHDTPAFVKGVYEAMKQRAADLAPQFGTGYGTKELTPDDAYEVWHRRAMPLEQEWALWRAVNEDGSPKYTPEQIGLLVFPDREKLAKSGGRVEPAAWISWTNQQAKRMAAKRAERQQALEMPMEGGTEDGLV